MSAIAVTCPACGRTRAYGTDCAVFRGACERLAKRLGVAVEAVPVLWLRVQWCECEVGE